MKRKIFSQEQLEDILKKYQKDNWSQKEIANYYKVSRPVIKRLLNEMGVTFRQRTKKYYSDDDIFEVIDNSEKAYWLGFLAADGCNYQREHNASIILNIHQKDIEHLEKFKQFCNSQAKIQQYITSSGYSANTPMAKIVLNSKKMSKDLIDKGIVPKKSLILKPPNISKQYYLPFILGYFDGDGSISKASQYNNYAISIEGTREILEWINENLNISKKLEKRRYNDNKNSYYIRCGGTNKPYNILKQLYDSCETHLDRKYTLFKELETVVLSRNVK